jgi:GH15 family glucan-1,4-alpha-glucosidase
VRLEDYGLIGDLQSAALVGSNGSVDWLCLPRFDSPSCFSALLGNEAHGCWIVSPAGEVRACSRRYRPGTQAAGHGATTPTPRLWPGWCSTAPYNSLRDSRWTVPWERWKQIRDEIHREVCEKGYDAERRTFTQYYGSKELDASVLNIPLVGFLPGSDERVADTIDAVSSELSRDGFVSRYSTAVTDDGLSGDEGQFLACSFWLVSALAVNGRVDEARELFERVIALNNDLGLLAEEYDVKRQRQVGNFPQAFNHLKLIGAAVAIAEAGSTAAA